VLIGLVRDVEVDGALNPVESGDWQRREQHPVRGRVNDVQVLPRLDLSGQVASFPGEQSAS
jgi:hypothetical protein